MSRQIARRLAFFKEIIVVAFICSIVFFYCFAGFESVVQRGDALLMYFTSTHCYITARELCTGHAYTCEV